mgnify:CR=1 FL=1
MLKRSDYFIHGHPREIADLLIHASKEIEGRGFAGVGIAYEGDVEIREDAPNGKLIGKTHLKYFNKKKRIMKYYKIDVKPTKDEASLYLVFKNKKDKTQYVTNANWILLNYKR